MLDATTVGLIEAREKFYCTDTVDGFTVIHTLPQKSDIKNPEDVDAEDDFITMFTTEKLKELYNLATGKNTEADPCGDTTPRLIEDIDVWDTPSDNYIIGNGCGEAILMIIFDGLFITGQLAWAN